MMIRLPLFFFITLLLHHTPLQSSGVEEMMQALETAARIDRQLSERFPAIFNHTFSTGYFVTHSARMTNEGSIGIGLAHAPPYLNWNVRLQPFSHLELSANYRVFMGCEDPVLGPHGFGAHSDRGANVKFAIFTPDESLYMLPGIALGVDDFMGSKKFTTFYIVGTQVFRQLNMECSFGWGTGQYTNGPSRGFFAGMSWFPWWDCSIKWTRGCGLAAEFDPTNYQKNPHPAGRKSVMPINFGLKYALCDFLEFSASYIRGMAFAASGSLRYNWGKSCGFLPKIGDPLPYTAPIDKEPLGCMRPEKLMIHDMNYALEGQGFQLINAWLENRCGSQHLWISVINCRYRQEQNVRMRLQSLLSALVPSNITGVIVILESYGLPCQQYEFSQSLLRRYASRLIGPYEFDLLSPRHNASPPPSCARMIFQRRYEVWKNQLSPRFETFIGSARGKFKYDVGIKECVEGFLPRNSFYAVQASYTVASTLHDVTDFDLLHPSQLPNVATDYVRYRQQSAFTWDMLYLQKSWHFGQGYFGRMAGGYFQVNYAGIGAELLRYPANSCFAVGIEGAVVKKRRYRGLGFQSKLRHFDGTIPVFKHYSTLQQWFLNLYFDFPAYCFFTKISLGQFLARDHGARLEFTRYFESGFRLTGWITITDAFDVMHGEKYYDRGIAIEMPLDIFYKCSSRRVWNYATAAWLRDAGYATTTGVTLFNTINRERR